MVTTQDISKKLSEAIKRSGCKQEEIAKYVGVKQQQISNYVKGLNLPALDTLSRLCTFLDLDANDILCVESNLQYK